MSHRMMPKRIFSPERPSLPWQRNLGHNGLKRGLRKSTNHSLKIQTSPLHNVRRTLLTV